MSEGQVAAANSAEVKMTITESGQDYLTELLAKQGDDVLGVRVFITQPGTPKAETCIAYCREGDDKDDDIRIEYPTLAVFVEARSIPFLEDATVDYAKDRMGGQLTIKAPNSRLPRVNENSPLEDRVNYLLYNEVNPSLAAHGGEVSLVEITEDKYAILKFGGGCQGCGMVDVTLKEGVEKSMLEQIPELKGVRDMTDHSNTENAYFK
ncbi:MAG TPA: Fe/S biogenesis protein NfuA [Spongiibacteraceae bacterium]|nr:Fe/S biogenesis protein NfuA [Spongiibacteraceae bacterium]HCS27792.1 Fe/S biogenesis protein NfuA [Spongiibacteraceae bacterium]|tara:strand:- start:125 stop:748 length:624 start_codon:yes stop_codon:yes gene_type:complete